MNTDFYVSIYNISHMGPDVTMGIVKSLKEISWLVSAACSESEVQWYLVIYTKVYLLITDQRQKQKDRLKVGQEMSSNSK